MRFPEARPPDIYPPDMNEHLQGPWMEIRNGISRDQEGVDRCLNAIKSSKQTIKFLKERILASAKALEALNNVKG